MRTREKGYRSVEYVFEIIAIVGTAAGVMLLIAHGAMLQKAIGGALEVTGKGIYDNIYEGSIALYWDGASGWIGAAGHWIWATIGIPTGIVVTRTKSWLKKGLAGAGMVAGGLTAWDVITRIDVGEWSWAAVLGDIWANIAGGIGVGLLIFVSSWVAWAVRESLRQGEKTELAAVGVSMTLAGAGGAVALYVVLGAFLLPSKIEATVIANLPIEGTMGIDKEAQKRGEKVELIRKDARAKGMNVTNINNAKWKWEKEEMKTKFEARIWAVSNCTDIASIEVEYDEPSVTRSDITEVELAGLEKIHGIAMEGDLVGLSTGTTSLEQFWVEDIE